MDGDLKLKKFHFIAIGGVGQSALAKILAIKGYKVSGSDICESKYTKMLENLGVDVSIGHKSSNVSIGQTIVLSSAIKEDNPEYIRAKELNLQIFHRSDILKFISELYPCFIGFSGTHGKTTTSSLCSYILDKIGINPAYAVGGIVSGLDTNANTGKNSEIFIAELDESDGTIVKYSPDFIAINNLEPDHFDFYKNGEKDLLIQFSKFIKNLKDNSKVFVNIDDSGVCKLLDSEKIKNLVTYSIKNKNADYFADEIVINDVFNSFKLYKKGLFLAEIKTSIKGIHNVYNVLCVISVLLEKGFNIKDLIEPLSSFLGAKRRYEMVYNNKATIIDDYAHHPTEIKATLNSAKKQTKNKLTVIFQPHRYTRLKALWNEFLSSFELADNLFVIDTFSAGDKFDTKYNSENFAHEIKHKNVKYIKGDVSTAAREIFTYLNEGDYILTIGAGDVTKIGRILGELYEN